MHARPLYDGTDISQWENLLSSVDMHYHFGCKGEHANPFVNSVIDILPYLEGHVLDLGCGYGGPARFLSAKGHTVTCVSDSAEQLNYVIRRTPKALTIQHDLNHGLPSLDSYFNTVLMFESFSHIKEQRQLLTDIRQLNVPLVMVAHATYGQSFFHEQWQMQFHNYMSLLGLIEDCGFVVQEFSDQMPKKAVVTAEHWTSLLNHIPHTQHSKHLQLINELSHSILSNPQQFLSDFGLFNIYAEPI